MQNPTMTGCRKFGFLQPVCFLFNLPAGISAGTWILARECHEKFTIILNQLVALGTLHTNKQNRIQVSLNDKSYTVSLDVFATMIEHNDEQFGLKRPSSMALRALMFSRSAAWSLARAIARASAISCFSGEIYASRNWVSGNCRKTSNLNCI